MPDHLMKCHLCLEAFEVILKGTSSITQETVDRYLKECVIQKHDKTISGKSSARIKTSGFKRFWFAISAIFAIVFVILIFRKSKIDVEIRSGELYDGKNNVYSNNFQIPNNLILISKNKSEIVLEHTFNLQLGEDTIFVVNKSWADRVLTVFLQRGFMTASSSEKNEEIIRINVLP